ncbi:hypothetical protein GOODEAATRI_007959 [Goodea atripinnis]|uniref:Uncharacterized protein n=1 Tax=Goodea atripinnis TaxID=208336 RepID=A0ABV0N8V6_9TELE
MKGKPYTQFNTLQGKFSIIYQASHSTILPRFPGGAECVSDVCVSRRTLCDGDKLSLEYEAEGLVCGKEFPLGDNNVYTTSHQFKQETRGCYIGLTQLRMLLKLGMMSIGLWICGLTDVSDRDGASAATTLCIAVLLERVILKGSCSNKQAYISELQKQNIYPQDDR